MNHNKNSLESNIRRYEYGILMSKDILDTVKQFEHYKQVNNRFCEALKAKGYSAYICKDNFSSKLVCNFSSFGQDRVEFCIYHSEFRNRIPFTWDEIKKEVARYNFEGKLAEAKLMLDLLDSDTETLKTLMEYVKSVKLTCFDLYSVNRELENAYLFATKGIL